MLVGTLRPLGKAVDPIHPSWITSGSTSASNVRRYCGGPAAGG
jgi:hypothetical protein